MAKHGLLAGLGDDLYSMLEEPQKINRIANISGERFGRLVVMKFLGVLRLPREEARCSSAAIWLCRCDCGKEIPARGGDLRHGCVSSCGCAESGYQRRSRRGTIKRKLTDFLEPFLSEEQLSEVINILTEL